MSRRLFSVQVSARFDLDDVRPGFTHERAFEAWRKQSGVLATAERDHQGVRLVALFSVEVLSTSTAVLYGLSLFECGVEKTGLLSPGARPVSLDVEASPSIERKAAAA